MKTILRFFGHLKCWIWHDMVKGKHRMEKAYGPYVCQICGRKWSILD